MGCLKLLLGVEGHAAGVLALLKRGLVSLQNGDQSLCVLVASSGYLLLLSELTLYRFEVFELQFSVYYLLVFYWIDGCSALSHHVVIIKAAYHMYDGVTLAYVSKKLIAQSFAFRRTLYEAGNVYYLAGSRYYSARMNNLGELRKALVGHGNNAKIRLYRTERKVCCLCFCTAQAVEKGRLSNVWKAYNTTF